MYAYFFSNVLCVPNSAMCCYIICVLFATFINKHYPLLIIFCYQNGKPKLVPKGGGREWKRGGIYPSLLQIYKKLLFSHINQCSKIVHMGHT